MNVKTGAVRTRQYLTYRITYKSDNVNAPDDLIFLFYFATTNFLTERYRRNFYTLFCHSCLQTKRWFLLFNSKFLVRVCNSSRNEQKSISQSNRRVGVVTILNRGEDQAFLVVEARQQGSWTRILNWSLTLLQMFPGPAGRKFFRA